ncbi:MAG: UDP-glucose/GDP-mannose dehydrogenase family protein [Dehalococcoidia bacterium]
MASVAVVGAGYVGLVTAACLAELGHDVTAIDRNAALIGELARGTIRIHEPGLTELVRQLGSSGRLRFATSFEDARRRVDVAVVAVGTPPGVDGHPDLRAVFEAVEAIVRAAPGAVICLKSTVPPGTGALVGERLRARGLAAPVVVNPEFLREGQAVLDFMQADRIVIGAEDEAAGATVARLYRRLRSPVVRCSAVEAELAKYASNALLASRVSFINEMSGIADAVGADIAAVSGILGMDRRIGPSFLNSGLGWGGSCFPKDVAGLASLARSLGCSSAMLDASVVANERQRSRAAAIVVELGGSGGSVAVLGLAFKAGTNDIRESPSLGLVRELLTRGCSVRGTDPLALEAAARDVPEASYEADAYRAARGADVVVVATDWPEYRALDWTAMAAVMRGSGVLDARNALDVAAVERAGLVYRSLGREAARSAQWRDPMAVVQ